MKIRYKNTYIGNNKSGGKEKKHTNRTKNVENKIKITGIIVCVDFSDFLKETLHFNKEVLDDLYIVTADDDIKTHKLCKKTNTKCLSIPRTTPTFLRGVYINNAFNCIPHKDWFLITDVDIVLPSKEMFDVSMIAEKPECLYGVFCQYCNSYTEWCDYKENRTKYNWHIKARTFHVGMGAFQLFHTNHFHRKGFAYPPYTIILKKFNGKLRSKGADFIFSRKFPCKQKLPFNVLHLSDKKNIKDTKTRQYRNINNIVFNSNDV